jgi:hypothetical protein
VGEIRIQAHLARAVWDERREARGQHFPQSILIPTTESISERPETVPAQNETVVLNLPEVFALGILEDQFRLPTSTGDT